MRRHCCLLFLLGLWLLPTRAYAQATALQCAAGVQLPLSGWPARTYQVFAMDSNGVPVSSFTGFVTATINQAPSGGTLGGTITVQAATTSVTGLGTVSVATFTNLILTGTGDWRITFSASGVSSCTTNTFTVLPSYHLGSSSAARGFGLAIPGTIVTDFDGCDVAQSGQIDAGALQYRTQGSLCSGNAPPPVTAVLPAPQNFRFGP